MSAPVLEVEHGIARLRLPEGWTANLAVAEAGCVLEVERYGGALVQIRVVRREPALVSVK